MTPPTFEVADELSKDLSNFEAMWFLLEEFNTGLQELAKEDWISFRYCFICFNLYLTNGFSHHYQLDESIFIFRGVRSDF